MAVVVAETVTVGVVLMIAMDMNLVMAVIIFVGIAMGIAAVMDVG